LQACDSDKGFKFLIDKSTVRIGCISWTYPDWQGAFYPPGTQPSDYLSLYSRAFDIVEIDATFYRSPSVSIVKQWKSNTLPNFLFSAKLPRKITHDLRLKDITNNLKNFETAIKNLGTKLACIIAQLPPNFRFEKNFSLLENFFGEIDPTIRYAIEFRNDSWFREETYELLRGRNVSLAWSVTNTRGEMPAVATSDFIYLRFLGRFGEFSRFDRVQKERTDTLERWRDNLLNARDTVRQAYVMMSNHFEGFAPETANRFRAIIGLEETNWKEKMKKLSENSGATTTA
jgi:uncharacterized protein YecE (DUF72 family)